jgi:hypothetical protein
VHVRIFSTTAKQNHGSEREEKCNQKSTMGENSPKIHQKVVFFPQVINTSTQSSTHQHNVINTSAPINTKESSTHQQSHRHTSTKSSTQSSTHQHIKTTHQHYVINIKQSSIPARININTCTHRHQHRV